MAAPVNFISLDDALTKVASYGFRVTRNQIECAGTCRLTGPRYVVVVLDYRFLGKPYVIDWVFSIEDTQGQEIRRCNVRRH